MLTELDKKNFEKWEEHVKKIALSKDTTATIITSPAPTQPDPKSSLKIVMNNNAGMGKTEVYVQYVSELELRGTNNEFIIMTFKWYPTRLVVEQTLVRRTAGTPDVDEELSYGATIYTNFSGVRIQDGNAKGSMITLLHGKEEENLPMFINSKDARKLIELIGNVF